jgi:hypothetical protein
VIGVFEPLKNHALEKVTGSLIAVFARPGSFPTVVSPHAETCVVVLTLVALRRTTLPLNPMFPVMIVVANAGAIAKQISTRTKQYFLHLVILLRILSECADHGIPSPKDIALPVNPPSVQDCSLSTKITRHAELPVPIWSLLGSLNGEHTFGQFQQRLWKSLQKRP